MTDTAPKPLVSDDPIARLVARLRTIAGHDWRVSHIAHTSDTANEAADEIDRLLSINAATLAALTEAGKEVEKVKADIIGAREDNFKGTAHPRFDEVSQKELARIEAMLMRIRAALKARGNSQ